VERRNFPPMIPIIVTGLLAAGIGVVGLVYIVLMADPELFPRWLFFFMLFLTLSGTALPFVAYLNRRFTSDPPAGEAVIVRQTIWVGVFGGVLSWLQLGRILNPAVAIFLAIGLILLEILIRLGERARWKPRDAEENE
jgi:hypothetical protein